MAAEGISYEDMTVMELLQGALCTSERIAEILAEGEGPEYHAYIQEKLAEIKQRGQVDGCLRYNRQ